MPHNKKNLLDFQRYQHAFTQYLRAPETSPRPEKVPTTRMAIYTKMVFNNIDSHLSACFPIAKNQLGIRKWQKLIRAFITHHRATTPIFRHIPQEFLDYVRTMDPILLELPPFLADLLHYEWIDLAIATADVNIEWHNIATAGDLIYGNPILNPTLELLQYSYPVHKISTRNKYRKIPATVTQLLGFRDSHHQVHFMEINPMTMQLLALLETKTMTGEMALKKMAQTHPEILKETIQKFGSETLEVLRNVGAILGTMNEEMNHL